MSEELLGSFQSFSKCTVSVEQRVLGRLVQIEGAKAARADIEFALGIVNQCNQLFSKHTAEIRKHCEASSATSKAYIESAERAIGVVVAAFKFLHANRSAAQFNPLALEKTMSNFTTACANAHLGLRAWDGLSLLRAFLLEHAEAHTLAPTKAASSYSSKDAGANTRAAPQAAGRSVRKPASRMNASAARTKGTAQRMAATSKESLDDSLARGVHRLSISKADGKGRLKEAHANLIHFPVRYCKADLAFNNLVITLLCNFLRILSQDASSKRTAQLAKDLACKDDGPLDWCLRIAEIDSSFAEPFFAICFKSYYTLGSISDEFSLEIRLLGLIAYSKTKGCDYRELLKYATRAAARLESLKTKAPDNSSRIEKYYSRLIELLGPQMPSLSVSPELVEFAHHASNAKQEVFGLEAALDSSKLLLHTSQGKDDMHARLVSESLSVCALIQHTLKQGKLQPDLQCILQSMALLADGALDSKARHTLSGWNALVLCADMIRKLSRQAFGELRQPRLEHIRSDLSTSIAHTLDVAGRIYDAYISRGAAAKAESAGGTSVSSLASCNAEIYLLAVQLALQNQSPSAPIQELLNRHSSSLLTLCRNGRCSIDYLRNHSTVFFNRGASQYQLKLYSQAAQSMKLAICSLEQWISTSLASGAPLGDAFSQLYKRYEVACSSYQYGRLYTDAAKLYGHAVSWIIGHSQTPIEHAIVVNDKDRKTVLPPYSSWVSRSSEAERISQFIDRYIRMCASRFTKDPEESESHKSIAEYMAGLSTDSLVVAWLHEVEAYHWRPFSNASSASAIAMSRHLSTALEIYQNASPLGYARCLVELAKASRDNGEHEKFLDSLFAAMEISKELSEDSVYVLSTISQCYAWRVIGSIERGDRATDDISACIKLWSLMYKRTVNSISNTSDASDNTAVDNGLMRETADLMNRVVGLLMSRRMHTFCVDILTVLLNISSTCEQFDRSWAPTTMESLIALGTASLLQGDAKAASEHFCAAAFRYEYGVLPAHVEVASKIAYATFQLACGDADGGSDTMLQASKVARGALDLGSVSRSSRTKRSPATPETLVLLSKASHAYSVLAVKRGQLAESIDFGLHSYRILYSLLKSMSMAHKRSATEHVSGRSVASEEDPFAETRGEEANRKCSPDENGDDKSDAQFLAFSGNWELQRLLIDNMAHLAEAYSRRGSVRETEYFLKRGLEISTQMQAPYAEGYMRMQEIDVLSRKNLWDSCADTLQKIRAVSEDQAGKPAADVVGAMEAAGAFMLEGDSWRRCKDYRRAHEAYRRAMDLIEDMSAGAIAEEVSLIAANPAKMTPRLERIIGQMSPVQKPAVGDNAIRASGSNEAAMQLAVTRDDLATRQQLLASIAGTVDEAQRQQSNNSDSQAARCIDERPEYLLMQANLLFVELQRMLEEEESWSTVLSSTLMFPALQRSRAQKPRRGTIKALIKGKLAELEELLALAVPAAITIGSAHCVHESCHLLALTKAMGIAFGLSSSDAECAGDVIARVIDGAKNITAVREAVDALRHRGEDVPSQLTLWPTDIRDNNGGTSDDAQGFGSDAGSSPLGYRLGANRLSSARPNKPKMPHASGSPEPLLSSLKRLSLAGNGADSDSSEDGAESQDQVLMRAVDGNRVVSGWAGTADAQSYSLCSTLPPSWIACGISIDRSRNVMFITRYQNGHEPVAICLPMRAIEIAGADALRNGLDDEKNPDVFDEVYQNLRAIIAESDETMKTGSNCKTDDEKRRWWLHRTQLDKQLKDLLEGIEDQWLGGFRSILQPKDSPDCGIDVSLLQRAIQQCIIKSLPKTFAAKAKLLDLSHTTCLFVLHVATRIWHQQNSRDADQSNDWLDVCSMLLDAYCYQGAAPALDEEGISKFADALKDAVLDVVGGADISDQPSAKTGQRKHLILVLDKHAQQIPWECLPCLCDYPISRVPSVAFLQHRLSLIAPGSRSAWSSKRANSDASGLLFESLGKRAGCPNARGSSEHAFSPVPSLAPSLANLGSRNNESNMPSLVLVDQDQLSHPPGVSVDGSRVFYILNPEGDLHRTQSNFEGYLRGQASWHGVLGRKPMNHECEHGISSSDLFLYFGHGGAEKYISRTQIHKLRRCAVSLLVGCSSGQLRPAGEYDAMGTAMDYMISGCPALVANLWDVGDKDIDRFTAEMLHLWGLDEHTSGKHAVKIDTKRGSKAPVRPVSLAEAVCSARRACRMAFLTGAAPVVYGIPAYLY